MKSIIEYLTKKPSLKGQVFDKGELKRLARVCGLSPRRSPDGVEKARLYPDKEH
jgi:hypothetical protein